MQEIGIRMALGAEHRSVLALVLRQGLMLTIAGIALGLLEARLSARLLEGMLFGITPLDPLMCRRVADVRCRRDVRVVFAGAAGDDSQSRDGAPS